MIFFVNRGSRCAKPKKELFKYKFDSRTFAVFQGFILGLFLS